MPKYEIHDYGPDDTTPLFSNYERLDWLLAFGFVTSDIAELTGAGRLTIRRWRAGKKIIDEEPGDRIWSLYSFARQARKEVMYHRLDIIGMTRHRSPLLMRHSLLSTLACMPETRHKIAIGYAESMTHPELAATWFGEVALRFTDPELLFRNDLSRPPEN